MQRSSSKLPEGSAKESATTGAMLGQPILWLGPRTMTGGAIWMSKSRIARVGMAPPQGLIRPSRSSVLMRAKLIGFLRPPEQVIQRYQGKENTLEARYALAVAVAGVALSGAQAAHAATCGPRGRSRATGSERRVDARTR